MPYMQKRQKQQITMILQINLLLFDGAWTSLTGKPSFATVATSGSYNDLLNRPTLFDGTWTNITGKPTTLAGYGITDGMSTSHATMELHLQ